MRWKEIVVVCLLLAVSGCPESLPGGDTSDTNPPVEVAQETSPPLEGQKCEGDLECIDGHSCTLDRCENGYCVNNKVDPLCCASNSECDDLDPCTNDKCDGDRCKHSEIVGCCRTFADCSDGDTCTFDVCVEGRCIYPIEEWLNECACFGNHDCDDHNDCSMDACLDTVCTYDAALILGLVAEGCCLQDGDCDDADATTVDKCEQFICTNRHEAVCIFDKDCADDDPCSVEQCIDNHCVVDVSGSGCCSHAGDCADGNPCTTDLCVDFECAHEANPGKPGCCLQSSDCDDDIKCTKDICISHHCKWFLKDEECCHGPADCPPADKLCQTAVCKNGFCTVEGTLDCCETDEDCNDDSPCTTDKCEIKQCFYWEVEGCCVKDSDCDDDNSCTTEQCVDNACVEVGLAQDCCANAGQCNDGNICTIDWCIDNQCVFEEKPDCCKADPECKPDNDCKEGYCVNGNCVFTLGPGCCTKDADCDDGDDECTEDLCLENACAYELTEAEGCCLAEDDCGTPDICLDPVCGGDHKCGLEDIPGCCHEDADCDDGDDVCTDDACIENWCVITPNGTEGCCEEFTWDQTFDDGTDGGFTFVNAMDMGFPIPGFEVDLGWMVAGECGFNSAPAALYYGTVADGFMGLVAPCTYAMDPDGLPIPIPMENNGTATSGQFELPAAPAYTLKFTVMADIADDAASDALYLEVLSGGAVDKAWEKADLDSVGPSWHDVEIDVSEYAGDKVSLRFTFDTLGSQSSDGAGVFIDDLSVTADCSP